MNDDGSSVTVSLERKEYKIAYSPETPEYKDAIAELVDVAITGPLALVACDDDVETVSGDVDVDFADP